MQINSGSFKNQFPLGIVLWISCFLLFVKCSPKPNAPDSVTTGECTKYVRDDFGYPADIDHDCQNSRAEVLINLSLVPVTFTTSNNCTVATGKWVDPYSGDTVLNASDLQIDHLVPLSEANKSGAYAWTTDRKKEFGNDFENMVPTKSALNTQKSDSDPGDWLPPKIDYRKTYCDRFIGIKEKYGLTVDQKELDTLTHYSGAVPLKIGVECLGN